MDDRSEVTSGSEAQHPEHGERPAQDQAPRGLTLALLRLALVGMVLVAGLAVAAPSGRRPVVAPDHPGLGVCKAPVGPQAALALPPGHPPVRGFEPQGRAAMALPPGHPPISGPDARPLRARPLGPVFAAPATVDL